MDSMERATESRPRGELPIATWVTLGLLILGVLLSIGIFVFVFFLWGGTVQQEEAAVGPSLLVLLAICGCALAGVVFGIVGLAQARRGGVAVIATSIIVLALDIGLLIASVLQGAYYLFIFAFIGG